MQPQPIEPVPPIPPAPTNPPVPLPGDRRGLAVASLVLGIISLCGSILWFCGGPLAIAAIILGVLGLKSSGRTMAMIGIILGAIAILMAIVFVIIGLNSGPILQQIQRMQQTLMPTP